MDIINEDTIKYQISEDYEEKTEKILNELVGVLPDAPFINHKKRNNVADGTFWFNKYDLLRSGLVESSQYIGHPQEIHFYADSKNNNYDVEVVKEAFRIIFGANINEGIFDNNIDKKMPEYEWVLKLHDALSKFFNTKNFNWVDYGYYTSSYHKIPSSIFKDTLLHCPTIEKDEMIVSLSNISLYNLKDDYEYAKMSIVVYVYEKKDPAKIAEIKAANDARKPLDVVGRELKEGDTVAYADLSGYHGGYSGMVVVKIIKASKDQVKFDNGKSVYANRCCLISRKDGKRIE